MQTRLSSFPHNKVFSECSREKAKPELEEKLDFLLFGGKEKNAFSQQVLIHNHSSRAV
jgi:hypothetical protein